MKNHSKCIPKSSAFYAMLILMNIIAHGPLYSHFSTMYGINRRSVLEDVPGFSVVTSLPHDIMHDLFEGIAKKELNLFFSL